MPVNDREIVAALKKAFEGTGWSQDRLAEESGVPRSKISRIFLEESRIDLDAALKLDAALGVGMLRQPSPSYSSRVKTLADQLQRLSPKNLEVVATMIEGFVIGAEMKAEKAKKAKKESS